MMGRTAQVQTHNTRHGKVAASTSAITLFTESGSMSPVIGRSIWNDSTAILTILHGPQADLVAGNFSAQIAAGGYYEVPFGYVGEVSAQWAAANGYARTEEFL